MLNSDDVVERRPVLLILCGLPFSGKTALGAALAEAIDDAVHVEIDAINRERGLGSDAAPMEWAETYRVAYQRVENAMTHGQDVIFDATNYSRAQRDILRATARRRGGDTVVIFVDVPAEESRERWIQSGESGDSNEDFERVVDRFDPPQADERVLLFYPGMTVTDLMAGIKLVFEP